MTILSASEANDKNGTLYIRYNETVAPLSLLTSGNTDDLAAMDIGEGIAVATDGPHAEDERCQIQQEVWWFSTHHNRRRRFQTRHTETEAIVIRIQE
tara:strand:- start:2383 stop:2673 length:291 start_codon:yes stop_codon:yes gene_type:complete